MPIQDAQLMLMDTQDIHANSGATVVGQSVIYLPQVKNFKGTATNDSPNNCGGLYWNAVVEDTAITAGTSGSTVTFALYNDTDAVPTTGGDIIASKAITENKADGAQLFSIPLPAGLLKPYFGVLVTVASANLTAGAVTSWIGGPIQQGV